MRVIRTKFVEFDEKYIEAELDRLQKEIARRESEVESFWRAGETSGRPYDTCYNNYIEVIKKYNKLVRDNMDVINNDKYKRESPRW